MTNEPTDVERQDQIEELTMLHRMDQELSATLDFDSVLTLTMDWALRRTGASAGMYYTLTRDGAGLVPEIALGYPQGAISNSESNPFPANKGILGRSVRTRQAQFVRDVKTDPDYEVLLDSTRALIAMPIEVRDHLLGILIVEGDQIDTFTDGDVQFLKRLASRAAIAFDHARLYREAEAQADDMAALYSASRMISSSLERTEALKNSAQSLAAVMRVSSVILADYKPNRQELQISMTYRLPTAKDASDILPEFTQSFNLENVPEFLNAIKDQRCHSVSAQDTKLSPELRKFMSDHRFRAMLILPLAASISAPMLHSEVLGMALAVEGRWQRTFSGAEIELAEALGGQIASALRQVRLYADVRELETLKSEMIRMASHDLRNPLGNVMGYFEMLVSARRPTKWTPEDNEFIGHVRRSLGTMKSLIEDLLTLERVESERQMSWTEVNITTMVETVTEGLQSAANLKHHTLATQLEDKPYYVFGSATQLRQAISNLIENALKYTPDNGHIQVRLFAKNNRLTFEVQDNGFGIAPDRQKRLFQRFYRAHQPGTDHISGTGLGLSLVKTVIERHGGEVWVTSEPQVGSTFGFWLPLSLLVRPQLANKP